MCQALRGFIQWTWRLLAPVYISIQAILAVVDLHEDWRPVMKPAWRLIKIWKRVIPHKSRAIVPPVVLRAALAVSLVRGWFRWGGLLMLGFLALLHPKNILLLTRDDLIFPQDQLGPWSSKLLIRVREPKTARVAHLQHASIRDPVAISFLYAVFGACAPYEKLWPSQTSTHFNKIWHWTMSYLGIDRSFGLTPGCLREVGPHSFI